MKEKIKYIPILYLIFITIWLRLVNLGYSDYQGDEIKALFLPASGQGLFDFLLHQRKGPTQFIITYLVYLLHPSYSNESLTRSPFALVGILTIYFFYRLVKLHYGRTVALYASLFLTVNGLFIGLMRIVQYQPFVMFFSILALYAFSLALLNENWQIKGMYLGMLFWAIALLTHYDGIYISPFILYLLYRWYSQRTYLSSRTKVKHLVLPFAGLVLLLVSYYGPFFLSAAKDSQAYWLSRATGLDQSAKSSSMVTFRIYNPLFVIYIYLALGILSLVKIKKSFPIVLWFLFPWIILEVIISDPGTHIYGYLIPATILNAFGVVGLQTITAKC
jgi:4-amino-4-deoxy-L-arabinose transferase-like glycosyltransferase